MQFISDELSLTQLTFAGTHDSHATQGNFDGWPFEEPWTVTQTLSMPAQLQAGVRYLDLRVGVGYGMVHGSVRLRGTLDDVLTTIQQFLQDHPSEAVLVSIKWDADGVRQPPDMDAKIRQIWSDKNWYSDTSWPVLGHVRGQAILLRRFSLARGSERFGIDTRGFWGEQQHHYGKAPWDQQDDGKSFNLSPAQLWKRAQRQLERARDDEDFDNDVMHFTVISMSGYTRTPKDYADGINPRLMRFLGETANDIDPAMQRFGVIVLDFLEPRHAMKILSKSWQQNVYQTMEFNMYASNVRPFAAFPNGVEFWFDGDGILLVERHGESIWSVGRYEKQPPHLPRVTFQHSNKLVTYSGDGQLSWASNLACRERQPVNCRLRIMSGPPYIMIDSEQNSGEIEWTILDERSSEL